MARRVEYIADHVYAKLLRSSGIVLQTEARRGVSDLDLPNWVVTIPHVGDRPMVVNYDAEGVAEVMGLGPERSAVAFPPGFREESGRSTGGLASSDWDDLDHDDRLGNENASSPMSIEKAIEHGLPRQVLRHVAERIAGTDKAKVLALEWGVVPKTTLERRVDRLSPQESERTERVARLFVHARRALGSEDEARVFVMASHPELDGRSPIEAAKTDLGTRRAEQILNALEYGLAL